MGDAHLPFKQAVEARDSDALSACFTSDAVFYSPVSYKPFEGREALMAVLKIVMEMFEDFSYTDVRHWGHRCAVLRRSGWRQAGPGG